MQTSLSLLEDLVQTAQLRLTILRRQLAELHCHGLAGMLIENGGPGGKHGGDKHGLAGAMQDKCADVRIQFHVTHYSKEPEGVT